MRSGGRPPLMNERPYINAIDAKLNQYQAEEAADRAAEVVVDAEGILRRRTVVSQYPITLQTDEGYCTIVVDTSGADMTNAKFEYIFSKSLSQ